LTEPNQNYKVEGKGLVVVVGGGGAVVCLYMYIPIIYI